MSIAKDKKGRDTLVLGIGEVAEALGVAQSTVADLWTCGLFPGPCHTLPPLWDERTIRRWVQSACRTPAAY